MNQQAFLQKTNEKAKTRLFDESDYNQYRRCLRRAKKAAKVGKQFYEEQNMGGVANAYRYVTTTARWGIYVDPLTMEVKEVVDRCAVFGRNVKCVYDGGERAYTRDWRKAREEEKANDQQTA